MFGKTSLLQTNGVCQFLYCFTPNAQLAADLKSLSGATNLGKLDIVWRSNLGERGRLQTCPLLRKVRKLILYICIYKQIVNLYVFQYPIANVVTHVLH